MAINKKCFPSIKWPLIKAIVFFVLMQIVYSKFVGVTDERETISCQYPHGTSLYKYMSEFSFIQFQADTPQEARTLSMFFFISISLLYGVFIMMKETLNVARGDKASDIKKAVLMKVFKFLVFCPDILIVPIVLGGILSIVSSVAWTVNFIFMKNFETAAYFAFLHITSIFDIYLTYYTYHMRTFFLDMKKYRSSQKIKDGKENFTERELVDTIVVRIDELYSEF